MIIRKTELIENPDGTSSINKHILCKRIVYLNVYDESEETSLGAADFSKLECTDTFMSGNPRDELNVLKVHFGGFIKETVIEPSDSQVASGRVKVNFASLFVEQYTAGAEIKTQDSLFTIVGTKEMRSKSQLLSISPTYTVFCWVSSPPGETDPNPPKKCKMSLPVIYQAEIHIEDDQV